MWEEIEFHKEVFELAFYSDDDLKGVENDVKTGNSKAYHVGGIKCVIRGEGEELILVAAVGYNLATFLHAFAERAKATGFKTVRFNTIRSGIPKLAEKSGFHPIELDTTFRVIL